MTIPTLQQQLLTLRGTLAECHEKLRLDPSNVDAHHAWKVAEFGVQRIAMLSKAADLSYTLEAHPAPTLQRMASIKLLFKQFCEAVNDV
jgi:hypothetical protein